MRIKLRGPISATPTLLMISLALGGCAPSPQQLAQQARQREKTAAYSYCTTKYPASARTASNAVPFAKCVLQVLDNFGGSAADRVIASKRYELAEKFRNGEITYAGYAAQFRSEVYQIRAQQEMLENTRQVAKNTNCIRERQRVSANDYSGIDSTNGVIAVASLLGAVADGAAVSRACD